MTGYGTASQRLGTESQTPFGHCCLSLNPVVDAVISPSGINMNAEIYLYIYMYICIYLYMHIHTRVFYVNMYTYIRVYACIHIYECHINRHKKNISI
jgi:hypothetical protein